MDNTGRRYCPWTKNEEEKLSQLNKDSGGNIPKIMKYFPDRSPESLKQKIKNMKFKKNSELYLMFFSIYN